MENKDRTRVCKYSNCKHDDKIHIDKEPFVKGKDGFYHEDCYKDKTDLQLFRSLWCENISSTVVMSELNSILKQLLSKKGVSVDYLLFVLEYVINNKCNLHYPAGFRYYVDNQDIKKAYEKKNRKIIPPTEFVATDGEDNTPKFSVNKKPSGFNSILGG